MTDRPAWTVTAQVREDAERMFVAVADAPGAVDGDVIEFVNHEQQVTRRGRVTRRDGDHLIVELDR